MFTPPAQWNEVAFNIPSGLNPILLLFNWGLPHLSERSVDPAIGAQPSQLNAFDFHLNRVGMKYRTGVKFLSFYLTGALSAL